MIVPEKTIAFFPIVPDLSLKQFDMDVSSFLKPLNKDHKRDWFTPHFYRCLPLSIGNMQGFVFSSPFTLDVVWDGTDKAGGLKIYEHDDFNENIRGMNHVYFTSEFGHGILTAHFPVILRTPPNVNLMTIAPPNYPVPGISPMTGVVETDNLRFTFTLNFKIDFINTIIRINKDQPIMGIIPIPRYFCDSFELKNAYDIFDTNIIEEEKQIFVEQNKRREQQNKNNDKPDRLYYMGMDIRKNKFKNHQLPKGKK